jgi:HK97 family phage prohead protease
MTTQKLERRLLTTAFELRTSKTADGMKIGGYAARYNTLSSNLGGFRERILPGAFDKVLDTDPDVLCLFNHNQNFVLGRTSADTLSVRSTSKGLAFDCNMPETSYARDLSESMKRGDIKACSFAFELDDDDQEFGEEDTDQGRMLVRNIRNFKALHDVSVVTSPAYPGTSVDARNIVAAEVRSMLQARNDDVVFKADLAKIRQGIDELTAAIALRKQERATVRQRRQNLLNLM